MNRRSFALHWLFAIAALGACSERASPPRGQTEAALTAASTARAPLPARSIYQLASAWQDQQGEPLQLDVWRGHPVAIVLFFGTCESACPALVHEVQKIEAALPESARDALRVLLVTIDPEHDRVDRLAAYAREHDLPAQRWKLLRGDEDSVRELAAVLDVRYRRSGGGQFSHSLVITLLSRDGTIASRIEGIGGPIGAAVSQVLDLMN